MNSIEGRYHGPWECMFELSGAEIKITPPPSPNTSPGQSLSSSPAEIEQTIVYKKVEGNKYLSKDGSETMEVVKEDSQIRLRHYAADGDFWTLTDVYQLKAL